MNAQTRTIADLDVPLQTVAALATLMEATARTHSASDQIAYRLDEWLITHPDVACMNPEPAGWGERIAAMQKANDDKRKELGL
jgi:hypothetical protein